MTLINMLKGGWTPVLLERQKVVSSTQASLINCRQTSFPIWLTCKNELFERCIQEKILKSEFFLSCIRLIMRISK